MSEPRAFEYELTDDHIDRVAGATDINRKFLRALPGLLFFILISGGVLAANEMWLDSDGVIRLGALILLASFVGLLALLASLQTFAVVMLWLSRRRLRSWASLLPDRKIRWEFGDETFRVTSSESDQTVPWGAVTHVGTGEDFWTFRVNGGPELFLPASILTRDVRVLIRASTAEAKRTRRPAGATTE